MLVHTEQPNPVGNIQGLTFTVRWETNKYDSRVYYSWNVCDVLPRDPNMISAQFQEVISFKLIFKRCRKLQK